MQREDGEPELVIAPQYQHHAIAAFDAERFKIVRGTRRFATHVAERKGARLQRARYKLHRQLVGGLFGDLVHDVKGKVKMLDILKRDIRKPVIFVHLFVDKPLVNRVFEVRLVDVGLRRRGHLFFILRHALAVRVHDDRIDDRLFPVHRHQIVRIGAVVVDAVALVQDLVVIADADLDTAFEHHIKLLPLVRRQLPRMKQRLGRIRNGHVKRLSQLIFEHRRQVTVGVPLMPGKGHPLARAGDRVGGQARAVAFQHVGDLHRAGFTELVDEGKVEIRLAGFDLEVVFKRHFGSLGDLRRGKADVFAHGLNSSGHLFQGSGQHHRFVFQHTSSLLFRDVLA